MGLFDFIKGDKKASMSKNAENKSFDEIMQEITIGLTKNPEKDRKYLVEKMELYKGHKYSTEILRACGRLLAEMIPEERKREYANLVSNNELAYQKTLEEVNFNIYKKDFKKAHSLMEELVSKIDGLTLFEDDAVSTYLDFSEHMELILYQFLEKPEKTIRRPSIPYNTIYAVYGSLLFEMKDFEKAKTYLIKALRWNPMCAKVLFEYAETLKMMGDIEGYYNKSKEIYPKTFKRADMAHYLRNMAFYFVEKQEYKVASACLFVSLTFEQNNLAQSELFYIEQKSGSKFEPPTPEYLREITEQYNIYFEPNEEAVNVGIAYSKLSIEHNDVETAKYLLKTVYEFTLSDKIKEIYDSLQITVAANSISSQEKENNSKSKTSAQSEPGVDLRLSLYDEELKKIYRSKTGSFYVGRDSSKCALVFDDPMIARIHAQFILENGKWYIQDNCASNGTTINGIKLATNEKRILNVGDEIVFAQKKKLYVEKKLENKASDTKTEKKEISKEERSVIAFETTLKTISKNKGHIDNQTLTGIIDGLCSVPLYVGIKIDEKSIDNEEFTLLSIKMKNSDIIPIFTSVDEARKGKLSFDLATIKSDKLIPMLNSMEENVVINPFSREMVFIDNILIKSAIMPGFQKRMKAKESLQECLSKQDLLAALICGYNMESEQGQRMIKLLAILAHLSENSVWVPCTARYSQDDAIKLMNAKKGDKFSFEELGMKPDILQHTSGKKFFPVFSTKEAAPEEYRNNFSWMNLPFINCCDLTKNHPETDEIVINAFSNSLTLTSQLIEMINNHRDDGKKDNNAQSNNEESVKKHIELASSEKQGNWRVFDFKTYRYGHDFMLDFGQAFINHARVINTACTSPMVNIPEEEHIEELKEANNILRNCKAFNPDDEENGYISIGGGIHRHMFDVGSPLKVYLFNQLDFIRVFVIDSPDEKQQKDTEEKLTKFINYLVDVVVEKSNAEQSNKHTDNKVDVPQQNNRKRYSLDDNDLYFLSVFYNGNSIRKYSIDVEAANDSHYELDTVAAQKLDVVLEKAFGKKSLVENLKAFFISGNEHRLCSIMKKYGIDYTGFHYD